MAIAAYTDVIDMYKEDKKPKADAKIQYDAVMKWWKGSHSKDFLATSATKKKIFFAIVECGDAVWAPPGCVVAEMAHQEMRGWGLRIPRLTEFGMANIKAQLRDQEGSKREPAFLKAMVNTMVQVQACKKKQKEKEDLD